MATKTKKKRQLKPKAILEYEKVVPFDPNFKWPGTGASITFDAKSYTAWMRRMLPVIKTMKACKAFDVEQAKDIGVSIGDKIFYLRKCPTWHYGKRHWMLSNKQWIRTKLEIYRGEQIAGVSFSKDVSIPVLADDKMKPWMSLTPNEILTQRGQVRRAKGNVAIAGMGLGWIAKAILDRKAVKKLTVYDIDSHVLEFFGKSLIEEFGDRVEIIEADAYKVDWTSYDVSIWDIWKGYGDASWDDKFWDLKREMIKQGKVFIGWGEGVHQTSSNGRWR